MSSESKKSNRGGVRPGAGRPKGTTHKAKGLPKAKRVTIRMYPEDLEIADKLVELGYDSDRSNVIRKALQEVLQRLTPAC